MKKEQEGEKLSKCGSGGISMNVQSNISVLLICRLVRYFWGKKAHFYVHVNKCVLGLRMLEIMFIRECCTALFADLNTEAQYVLCKGNTGKIPEPVTVSIEFYKPSRTHN